VLEAAYQLVAEAGLKGATMDAITARSGVSKMTIYKWWGSRLPLLIDAFLRQSTLLLPISQTTAPIKAMQAHARRYVAALEGDLGRVMRAVIAECTAETGDLLLLYERYLSERRDLGVSVIRRGQQAGAITSEQPAERLYDQIYGTIFYRFLFHLPGLNPRFASNLVASTLSGEAG
jgi:AcrR family transcriptional regulator